MTIKSDYMTGYDNGWRDGVKDYKEKNKPFTAPTTESSPVAWIWHERAYELNGYEGRTRLAIDKPKMGPYECNLAPLYAAQTTGSAPVAGYFRETAWLSNGKRAIEQVPDTCREEDFVFPLFATPPANAPVASVPLKREFFQNWADYDAYRKSLIASPAASVLTEDARDAIQQLRVLRVELANTLSDPMWDAHAEVSKRALKRWHNIIDTYLKEPL